MVGTPPRRLVVAVVALLAAVAALAGSRVGRSVEAGPSASCATVAHIGDSLSVAALDALSDEYRRAGVRQTVLDASGGRSVVERLDGQPNGYEAATAIRDTGFRGCWVVALGTNDTANVAAGGEPGRRARIDRMMSVIGSEPVLWVTTRTLRTSGAYANENMSLWNDALREAAVAHPNLRIFEWAEVMDDSWFATDGIHHARPGSLAFARSLAEAVAQQLG